MSDTDSGATDLRADGDGSGNGQPVSAEVAPAPLATVEPVRRMPRWLSRAVLLSAVWLPVLWVEWRDLRNESLLALVLPPGELVLWLVAVVVTVLLVRRMVVRLRHTVTILTSLCLVAACTYLQNWSIFDPHSYFALHRQGFSRIAATVRSGLRVNDTYDGEQLPWYLADLSTTGRVEMVGLDVHVAFVPEFLGIPDGANGYLYVVGASLPSELIDLYGDFCNLSAAIEIGDSWYWC